MLNFKKMGFCYFLSSSWGSFNILAPSFNIVVPLIRVDYIKALKAFEPMVKGTFFLFFFEKFYFKFDFILNFLKVQKYSPVGL